MTRHAQWQPLLPASRRDEALAVVQEIAEGLRYRCLDPSSPPTLSADDPWIALFFRYLSRCHADPVHEQVVDELVERAITTLSESPLSRRLYDGFVGIAWLLAHLYRDLTDDTFEAVDQALFTLLTDDTDMVEFEYLTGLAGHGAYLLERQETARVRELLELVVDRLDESAQPLLGGRAWLLPAESLPPEPRAQTPNGRYQLGVAHGLAGAVGFLARCRVRGIRADKARALLGEVVHTLRRCADMRPGALRFSRWWTPAGTEGDHTLRWCWGDLGIATVLLHASAGADDTALGDYALELARVAARCPFEDSGVIDACLCHGSTGNGLMFHRLYQMSDEPAFAPVAASWYERALEQRQPGQGLAGYVDVGRNGIDNASFLQGVAGIGLGLLAAATADEPVWDRLLLLSG